MDDDQDGDLRVHLKTISSYFDPTYFNSNGTVQLYDENTSVNIAVEQERVQADMHAEEHSISFYNQFLMFWAYEEIQSVQIPIRPFMSNPITDINKDLLAEIRITPDKK